MAGPQCVRQDGLRPCPAGRSAAATIRVLRPLTSCQAATRRQPPAACVLPVLRPTIPSWPSSVLVLRTTPATGTKAAGIAVIAASAGTRIAAVPRRTWSAAVLTVDESRPDRVGVTGAGHAEAAGGGVHLRRERGLAAGVPPREYPGDVVGRGQQQRLKRLALGERLPGGDRHQRVAVGDLRRVLGCLRRLDRDIRARSARGQGMVLQDHVRGHQLGDAGDGHPPGRARAVRHAVAADAGGRGPCRRPRHRAQPRLARSGGPGRWRGRSWGPRRRPGGPPAWRESLCGFAMTRPARQPSAARPPSAARSVRLVRPPVTGSCSVRPPRGPDARWVHACDGAIPASPACPATVTAMSQRTPAAAL